MEAANREEAKKCLKKARDGLKSGEINYAKKWVLKSLKLCTSQEATEFLELLSNANDGNDHSERNESGKRDEASEEKSHSSGNLKDEKEHYTDEQDNAVRRVLQCKDYYEVLAVSRNATDSELKKQYKRLALALHPDKNRAPKSDEAFKAISKAYTTLSDPTHRNHYDRFGEDGLQEQNISHGDVSPDDLFRMFFGDGARDIYNDGFFYTNSNTFVFNRRRGPRHSHHHRQQDGGNLSHLCQVLPIMIILLVSLFSSFFSSFMAPPPPFSLRRNSEYIIQKMTKKYSIPYFVKADFNSHHHGRNIEKEVIELYIWELKEQCRYDRQWSGGNKSKACKKLKEISRKNT